MTIYADNMRGYARVDRGNGRVVTGRWSHLMADSPAELAGFAARLGLRPEWLQFPGTPREHYDIVEAVRRRAVAAGAIPISYPHGTGNLILTKRLQASALDAASRAWLVFPLRPGSKIPALRDWEHQATTDPERIRDLWTVRLQHGGWHVPEPANVGIACGPSGLVVVDLDVERPGQTRAGWSDQWLEHDITSGAAALAVVADRAWQTVPETYAVATPSGGRHLYFTAPADIRVRNSAGHLGPMIDVRGEGGYVVAAGSHPHGRPGRDDSAAELGALGYRLVEDRPPAELPGWLTAVAADRQRDNNNPAAERAQIEGSRNQDSRSASYAAAALRGEVDRVRSAPVGQRNHTLNSAAYSLGQLVAAGALNQDRAVEALTEAAGSAGLETSEIAATIASGLTAGANNPRAIPQAQGRRRIAGTADRSQRRPDANAPGMAAAVLPAGAGNTHFEQQQIGDPGRHTGDKGQPDLRAAFDQAAAVAVRAATRLVVDAAPEDRVAALREGAARIGRLLDVDGFDGQSALGALTAAAEQVGMVRGEIETTTAAGIAGRCNWPISDDNRPPGWAMAGSVVAELAARRKQAEFDAATLPSQRHTLGGQQLRSKAEDCPDVGTDRRPDRHHTATEPHGPSPQPQAGLSRPDIRPVEAGLAAEQHLQPSRRPDRTLQPDHERPVVRAGSDPSTAATTGAFRPDPSIAAALGPPDDRRAASPLAQNDADEWGAGTEPTPRVPGSTSAETGARQQPAEAQRALERAEEAVARLAAQRHTTGVQDAAQAAPAAVEPPRYWAGPQAEL